MATTHLAAATAQLTLTTNYDGTGTGGDQQKNNDTTAVTLSDTTTPAVTEQDVFQPAMTAGAKTFDLTAAVSTRGRTVNFTGLKVRMIKFSAPSTNSGTVTIAIGAANKYTGLGANFNIALAPGQFFGPFYDNGAGVAVAAGNKNLDMSGTGTDSLVIQIGAGA